MKAVVRRARGFGLVEAIVVLGIVAITVAAVAPALHLAAAAPQRAARRDAARRLARNVIVRMRAASAYDEGAVAALTAALPAVWTVALGDPLSGRTSRAQIAASQTSGVVTVTVTLDTVTASLAEPLRLRAPAPGSLLDPAGL
ncbi:hypothetical protein EPN44_12475 [bacterium]|nr:MAG: hypothetical protein EPN44_12475 [bacterium]